MSSTTDRKINTNNSFTGYINRDLLNLVIEKLGVSQLVYQPMSSKELSLSSNPKKNAPAETYLALDNGNNGTKVILPTSWDSYLPSYLNKLLETDDHNLQLCKVNITNSLLHSLLFFFDTYYKISSWERKENLIFQFKNKIIYDLDQDPTLMSKLKKENLRANQIKTDLGQEISTALLKEFLCLYFDINFLIITDDRLETFPPKTDIYKSWLILYQFPYGNFAPVYLDSKNNTESNTNNINVLTPNSSPLLKKLLDSLGIKDSDPDDSNNPKLVYNEKMSLAELQDIAQGLGIDIKKQAKNPGTYKNKTKKELIEELDKI